MAECRAFPIAWLANVMRALTLILLLAMPVAASAQLVFYAKENRLPRADPYAHETWSQADRGRITMINFAGCLIKLNRRNAMKFLTVFPGALDYRQRAVKIAAPGCLDGGALKFNEQLLRGSLFTQLYAERFTKSSPPLRTESIDYTADGVGQNPAAISAYAATRQFVECVVRAAPEASRAVVLVPIGSLEDDEAFKTITPILGPCLVQGAEVKLSRPALSGLLAEILYRLSTDIKLVSVAGKS